MLIKRSHHRFQQSSAVCLQAPDAASVAAPLRGLSVVLTRPAGQAGELSTQLRSLGAEAINLPLLRVAPAASGDPVWRRLAAIGEGDLVLPVSPYAARTFLKRGASVAGQRDLSWICVGPSTAAVLQRHNIQGVAWPPTRHDSEGLLDLPECQPAALNGRKVWIIAAAGGRELLADTLQQRGAEVEVLPLYQRLPCHPGGRLLAKFGQMPQPVCVISSGQLLQRLCSTLPRPLLQRLRDGTLLVPGSRLAALAEEAGFVDIQLAGSARASAIVAALMTLARRRQSP